MATLNKVTTAQEVYAMELRFKATDEVETTSGATSTVGKTGTVVFDAMQLPPNAVVVGGHVVVEVAGNATTSGAAKVGTAADDDAFATVASTKTAGVTAVTSTVHSVTNPTVRVAFTNTGGDDNSGVYAVRILYVVQGRQTVVTN